VWPHNGGTDISAHDMHLDSVGRRAYLMSSYGVLRSLDLTNYEMTHISGPDQTMPQTVRGNGPTIYGANSKLRADPALGMAYVTANDDSIIAVDMTTGARAIVSR
jgi:hypothetical protein